MVVCGIPGLAYTPPKPLPRVWVLYWGPSEDAVAVLASSSREAPARVPVPVALVLAAWQRVLPGDVGSNSTMGFSLGCASVSLLGGSLLC